MNVLEVASRLLRKPPSRGPESCARSLLVRVSGVQAHEVLWVEAEFSVFPWK